MRIGRFVATAFVAAAVVLVSAVPAAAETGPAPVPSEVKQLGLVEGPGWAELDGVECERSGNQVTCSPKDPDDNKPSRCFLGVELGSDLVTVCTTYEPTATALLAADGAKEAKQEYGCSFGDVVCMSMEAWGRGLAMSTTGMMFALVESTRFDTSGVLWDAATNQWSFWAWAVLAIVFLSTVWGIANAAFARDRDNVLLVLLRSSLAIAAIPMSLWLTGEFVNAVDQLVAYSVKSRGLLGLIAELQDVMFAGGQANYFWMYTVSMLLFIGIFLALLVFSFRNIALAALIMVGPLAWMLFPVRGIGRQWVIRYFSALATLLLTGPLTMSFLMLVLDGIGRLETLWDPATLPLLIGLMLIAFAPMAVFGLFSFLGAAAADALGSRMGDSTRRVVQSGARSAVSRIPAPRMNAARERAAGIARERAGREAQRNATPATRTPAAQGRPALQQSPASPKPTAPTGTQAKPSPTPSPAPATPRPPQSAGPATPNPRTPPAPTRRAARPQE